MRRAAWPLVAAVVVVGVFFVAVFPTRTYVAQRRDRQAAETQLRVLDEQNRRLKERVDLLHTDAEIERLAREQYNLVRPGEEAYALLPEAPFSKPAPKPAPAPTRPRR